MLRVARYEPGLVTNAIIRAGSNSWEHLASSKWKSGTALGKQTSNQQRIEGWLKFQMTTQQLETGNTEMYHTTELKPKQHLFICIYIYIYINMSTDYCSIPFPYTRNIWHHQSNFGISLRSTPAGTWWRHIKKMPSISKPWVRGTEI